MRAVIPALLIGSAVMLQGCAGVGLTMLGVGGGTAASAGVNHTLSGIAYKTFTAPEAQVHKATLKALNEMSIMVSEQKTVDRVRAINGKANERDVEIELEPLTPKTTRMRVTVIEEGGFFRDSATATEIIIQAATALDSQMAANTQSKSAARK